MSIAPKRLVKLLEVNKVNKNVLVFLMKSNSLLSEGITEIRVQDFTTIYKYLPTAKIYLCFT